MKHLIIFTILLLTNFVFGQTPPAGWSAICGGVEPDTPTKIKAYGNAVYVTSFVNLEDPMLMEFFNYGVISKFDANTGVKEWDLRLDIPSTFNDFVLDTMTNRLLVVGNTDPFVFNFNNESLILSIDAGSGAVVTNVSIDQNGREGFTRIFRNPNPANLSFPYYVIGSESRGVFPSGEDRPVLMTFDANLNADVRKQYEAADGRELESTRGVVPLANGTFLMVGNDVGVNNGTVLLASNTGELLKAFEHGPGIDWYDGVEMADGKVVLAGHLFFAGQGLVSVFNPQTGEIEQSLALPETSAFREIGRMTIPGDPRSGLFVTNRVSGAGLRNMISVLVYEPGELLGTTNFGFYDNDPFTLTDPKIYIDDEQKRVFYTDGRDSDPMAPDYAGIGGSDLLIAALPPSLELECFEGGDLGAIRPSIAHSSFLATDTSPDWETDMLLFSTQEYGGQCNLVCEPTDQCTGFTVELSVAAECFEGTYTATVTGGQGPFSYEWDFCNNDPPTTTEEPTIGYSALSPFALCYDATVTVTDANGCVTEGAVLLQLENEPPVLTCPEGPIVLVADPGVCFATYELEYEVTDDCDTDITVFGQLKSNMSRSSMLPNEIVEVEVGTDCVVVNALDDFGQTDQCTYEVIVLDEEAPTCPDGLTINSTIDRCAEGDVVIFNENFWTDNCTAPIMSEPQTIGSGDFFPLGTTEITYLGTDTSGNTGTCLVNVVVERGCGTPGQAELKCREGGYVLEVPYSNDTGGSNADCSFRATINHPAFPGTYTGNGSAVPGVVVFFLTTAELVLDPFVSISMTSVCRCDDGAFSRCTYNLNADVECCLELSIPDTVICENQISLEVPIFDLTGLPGITQVRYYVADDISSFGTPLQITNTYQPLDLAPTYHMGNIVVYAEVDFAGSACTTVTTNVANIQRCAPVTGSVPNQAYCFDGTPIQPDTLRLTLGGGDPNLCGDSIQWYDPDGMLIPGATGLSYFPGTLSLPASTTDCDQRFVYTAQITSVCGTTIASADIRLFNENDPVGQLTLDPQDQNPLCPGDDAILHYAPACTGDDMMWSWWTSTDGVNFTVLPDAGNQNPVYYTNRLYQDTWFQVQKQNGVCPVDTITLFIDIREELVLIDFQAAFDDVCQPGSVVLSAQVDFPSDCPQQELSWYRNGILLATTSSPTYTYLPGTGEGVAGNYQVVLNSPCCDQEVRSGVVDLEAPPSVAIAGPCFICNSNTAELTAVIEGATTAVVSLQWFADGMMLMGETGTTLTISDDTGDVYLLEMTDGNGCVIQASFTPYERCFIVGVSDLPLIEASVFPNPASDRLFVKLTNPVSFRELILFDALGRPSRIIQTEAPQERIEISLEGLSAGIYFLQGTTDLGVLLEEVVVK